MAGQIVKLTEHGKPVARISPDYPTVILSAEDFRALELSEGELNQAINEALEEIRA